MFDMKGMVVGTFMMLRKYTCINITVYADDGEEELSQGLLLLPVIGAVLGVPALLLSFLSLLYGSMFAGVVILIYYAAITKVSSLTESYKSLNYYIRLRGQSGQVPGITGIVAVCLLYSVLMGQVYRGALLVMFTAGYGGLILTGFLSDRCKDNTSIFRHLNSYHAVSALLVSFLMAAAAGFRLVISLSFTYMIIFCLVRLADRKIKILPDSAEGLIIEMSQLLFLLITFLLKF